MSNPIDDRFGGVARLYGNAAMQQFSSAHVAVIGIGGVGSWAAEALARSGIGKITLVDMDDICITNINRQLHATTPHIGRQKTCAMAERIRHINPNAEVVQFQQFFTEKSSDEILSHHYDAIIDAIDTTRHKAFLLAQCYHRKQFVVSCGGAAGRRDATRIRHADLAYAGKDPLLHHIRRVMRIHYGFPKIPRNTLPPPLGIEAVYSDEDQVFHQDDGSVSCIRNDDAPIHMSCDSGFGTATHVTAVFGLVAANCVLDHLAARASDSSTPTTTA